MNRNVLIASLLLAALSLFVIGAAAQHSQHQTSQESPEAETQAEAMMPCGMMSEGMMARHQEVEKLVDRLVNSFSALKNERDPERLESQLREHGALLGELQSKAQHHSEMMQGMSEHMKDHPMMGGEHKEH
jgi:hypothetical protein